MSIFKSSFSPSVQNQLKIRQKVMTGRTTQDLQYLNSRNAWIRMTSSVNVNGTNNLAKKYILQGGTLNLDPQSTDLKGASKKQGIGTFNNAYSNVSQTGTKYRLGIRPMPGITSIEVKSLSAYGSLREVTVNFQCWDIQQLEDLEVLYMRPGYTALIEWGWTPYFKPDPKNPNDSTKYTYEPNFTDYYDIINSPSQDRTKLFKDLYDKSVLHGGNYDAMFGYVKNYQWSARPDGGYDCQTNIISTGEIIESLKINYNTPLPVAVPSSKINEFESLLLPPGATLQKNQTPQGLLKDEFNPSGKTEDWIPYYQRNVLAGMWAELYYKRRDKDNVKVVIGGNSAISNGGIAFININALSTYSENSLSAGSNIQIYITLDTMCNLLNKYIIAKGPNKEPLVKLSVKSNQYESPITDLQCTAHPLQISVDPSICLIKNPLWYDKGGIITTAQQSAASTNDVAIADTVFNDIKSYLLTYTATSNSNTLIDAIEKINKASDKIGTYNLINEKLKTPNNDSLENILQRLSSNFTTQNTETRLISTLSSIGITYTNSGVGIKLTVSTSLSNTSSSQQNIIDKSKQALKNIQFLDILNNYFLDGKPENEIGIIKNIYVNVNYLFQQSLNSGLEAGDSNKRNEINLLSYLKKIISDIQSAIGNVNNFEIHVDPISNNVAKIIDVNYTESPKATYDKLFPLEVHNLESIVRSYTLQSQIFPNQGAVIAIGSQAKGGQLGIQTNTFIDFNRNLTDRIIPEKVDGTGLATGSLVSNTTPTIVNGMSNILNVFSSISDDPKIENSTGTDINTLSSKAKNSLRDIIVYFQSLLKSPGSNRNLIPTKFSCIMDGIGGLVIGHMFRLSKDIMPKGYRGEGIGSEIGNAITSISHTISNGDWSTQIDTLNIVLDNISSEWGSIDKEEWYQLIEASISYEVGVDTGLATPVPSNPNIKVIQPIVIDDITFYEEILGSLGAPITDENLKLFYAWRQAEGGTAAWNPFNTTWAKGFNTTPYNCNDGHPVKNYASRENGVLATVLTLKQNYYTKIRNGLINNEGAAKISTYIDEFYKWGTKNGVNKILAGNEVNPPSISRSTTQIASC